MKFIDQAKIDVIAGSGGDGLVSWRREKYLPNGGPDGGNGGDGGAVILQANEGLNTLLTLSFNPKIEAGIGKAGGNNCQTGGSGKDRICDVPVGTQIFYGERLVADISEPGSRWVAARGVVEVVEGIIPINQPASRPLTMHDQVRLGRLSDLIWC